MCASSTVGADYFSLCHALHWVSVVAGVVGTADPMEAFNQVDFAILVGAFPRRDGMERKDLLAKNAAIFEVQGKAINAVASRDVKVCVCVCVCVCSMLGVWMSRRI